jgi:type I restriction enzyme M protein
LVLKKDRASHAERSQNILFIDASQHFEKVKTQNYLREEDITKIIDTYTAYSSPLERGTRGVAEDKYSHVAPLTEVAENDYNLNIPRYVDTFEEEAPVDLAAVSKELREVAEQSRSTDATIADYCKQLGIDTPF